MAAQLIKCYLKNTDAVYQNCGYGEGKTWEEAQQNALQLAKQRDPNAAIIDNQVLFSGGSGSL